MLAFQEQLGEASVLHVGAGQGYFSRPWPYGLDETAIAAGRSKEALEKLI
jgi:hypothetical protein